MAVNPELIRDLAGTMQDAGTTGPNLGQYKTAGQQVSGIKTHEVVGRNYNLPQNASQSLLDFYDQLDNLSPSKSHEQRAGTTNAQVFARTMGRAVEVAAPVVASTAAREVAKKVLGAAGGPLVGTVVGLVSSGIRAGIQVSKIKETGEGVNELYQQTVAGKERQEGNWALRQLHRVSKALSYAEVWNMKRALKVEKTDAQIDEAWQKLNLVDDRNLEANIENVIKSNDPDKLKELKDLYKLLISQDKLTGFGNRSKEDIAKYKDILATVTFALINCGEEQVLNDSFEDAKDDIAKKVRDLKLSHVGASAVNGAIRSFAFAGIFELGQTFLEQAQNIVPSEEQIKTITDAFTPEIDRIKDLISSNETAIDRVKTEIASLRKAAKFVQEFGLPKSFNIQEHINNTLEPIVKRNGFENVEQYLANGGLERVGRAKNVAAMLKELQDKPQLASKVVSLAKKLGLKPEEVLTSIMTRSPYDLESAKSLGAGYIPNLENWIDKLGQGDQLITGSFNQGLSIAKTNLATEWHNLFDIETTKYTGDLGQIEKLEKELKVLVEKGGLLKGSLEGTLERMDFHIGEVSDKMILNLQKAGASATLFAADVFLMMTSILEGNVVYGDEVKQPTPQTNNRTNTTPRVNPINRRPLTTPTTPAGTNPRPTTLPGSGNSNTGSPQSNTGNTGLGYVPGRAYTTNTTVNAPAKALGLNPSQQSRPGRVETGDEGYKQRLIKELKELQAKQDVKQEPMRGQRIDFIIDYLNDLDIGTEQTSNVPEEMANKIRAMNDGTLKPIRTEADQLKVTPTPKVAETISEQQSEKKEKKKRPRASEEVLILRKRGKEIIKKIDSNNLTDAEKENLKIEINRLDRRREIEKLNESLDALENYTPWREPAIQQIDLFLAQKDVYSEPGISAENMEKFNNSWEVTGGFREQLNNLKQKVIEGRITVAQEREEMNKIRREIVLSLESARNPGQDLN